MARSRKVTGRRTGSVWILRQKTPEGVVVRQSFGDTATAACIRHYGRVPSDVEAVSIGEEQLQSSVQVEKMAEKLADKFKPVADEAD